MENEGYIKENIKNRINENDDTEQKERAFFIFVMILLLLSMVLNTLAPLLALGLIIIFDVHYIRNR